MLSKKELANIPDIIPPGSMVELERADDETPLWRDKVGKRYRVGYYSQQDGLSTIWLVDDNGSYRETTDRDFLLKYFRIIRLTKIKNYFGTNCKPLGPIKSR